MFDKIIEAAAKLKQAQAKLDDENAALIQAEKTQAEALRVHALAEEELTKLLNRYCYDHPMEAKRRII